MAGKVGCLVRHRDQVCDRYINGYSISKLAEIYGVTYNAIRQTLILSGVTRRSVSIASRKYSFDEYAFDKNSCERDYWVGFLMADGNIYNRYGHNPQISIGLNSKDVEHIKLFRKFVSSNHPIKTYKNLYGTYSSAIYLQSKIMTDALKRFGLVGKKTNREKVKILKYNRHFWRGIVDGDGSLGLWKHGSSHKKPGFSLVGSKQLLYQFIEFLRHNNIGTNTVPHFSKNTYSIGFSSQKAVSIIKLLYKKAPIGLHRKMEIAEHVLTVGDGA